MRCVLLSSMIFVVGCTSNPQEELAEFPKCFSRGPRHEAIKVVAESGNTWFYRHTWNDQDRVFEDNKRTIALIEKIPCDMNGYDGELVAYRVLKLEETVERLDRGSK